MGETVMPQYSDLPEGATVLHDPGGQQYSDLPPGATVVHAPQLDLSNRQGQGTYQMTDSSGSAASVPYGQVRQAAEAGYNFADDASRFRYAKDNAADPSRATVYSAAPGYVAPDETKLPLAMQAVGGIAKGAGTMARPVMDVMSAAMGQTPQAVSEMLDAKTPMQTAAKVGTMGAVIIPGAIAAPVATAGAMLGGTLGAGAGQIAGNLANLSPTGTQLLADAGGIAGGLGGGMGANRAVGGVMSYLRPASSPSIVPRTEMAARQLSSVILPAGKDSPSFIRAAQQEVPNVLDYAKRTDNPLNTQLEFSKAAKGYAEEVSQAKAQVLGPVQNKLVKTTGTGYGSQMNEGPDTYATLGEIDKHIVELNKQLDAPALNADDARRALATKTAMQAEVRGLTNIMRQNLSESSGLPVEQIADLWQRVPRAYELANDTDAAVTQRMQAAGQADLKTIKVTELPSRSLNFVRGSQVNVADRAFQRAIASFPGQSSPLPSVSAPTLPTAPIDRLQQLLSTARQRQEAVRNAFQPKE